MDLTTAPRYASWNRRWARVGIEVAFFADAAGGHRLTGQTTADESHVLWSVGYDVTTDGSWRTVAVAASNLTAAGTRDLTMTRDVGDRWTVSGTPRPELDGC